MTILNLQLCISHTAVPPDANLLFTAMINGERVGQIVLLFYLLHPCEMVGLRVRAAPGIPALCCRLCDGACREGGFSSC